MKELMMFILEGITGSKKFTIEEKEEDGIITLDIKAPSDTVGIVIGKGGRVIKSIQNLARVKARLLRKKVFLNVSEISE